MQLKLRRVFISYAHADDRQRAALCAHLSPLETNGVLLKWVDTHIRPASEWEAEILAELDRAEIILLLVSADFLASEYCRTREMPMALERHERGQALVIPVIVRPCDWRLTPVARLQALPRDKPVTNWESADDAWLEVVQAIAQVAQDNTTWPRSTGQDGASEAPYQVPEPESLFIGRADDVDAVSQLLRAKHRVVVIRGRVGGVGKTTLAQHVAAELRKDFQGGVLWGKLPTESRGEFLDGLMGDFRRSAASAAEPAPPEIKKRQFDALCASRPILIVLDNADSAEDVLPFLPARRPSKVLVTTRSALADSLPDAAEYILEPLKVEAAAEMLTRRVTDSETAKDWEGAVRVASALGGLPLAIRIAAGIIRAMHWSFNDYARRFEDSISLEWLSAGDSRAVRQSFTASYYRLDEAAQALFQILGLFRDPAISRRLLTYLPDPGDLDRVLLTLSVRGMVDLTGGGAVRLHTLMSRYARELLASSKNWQIANRWVAEAYRSMISIWDSRLGFHDYGRASHIDGKYGLAAAAHFEEAKLEAEAQSTLEAVADALSRGEYQGALLQRLETLRGKSELRPWLSIYWADLTISRRIVGSRAEAFASLEKLARSPDLKIASAALICSAKIALRANDPQTARIELEESLALKRQLQPPDERGISYILNELGHVEIHDGGKHETALKLHREALEIQQRLGDDLGSAYTLRRIGSIQLGHTNDPVGALATLERAERLASSHSFLFVLVSTLVEKAEALRRLEFYARCIDNLERALKLAKQTDNPFTVAQVYHRLVIVYERVEFFGRALDCAESAAELFESIDPREDGRVRNAAARLRTKIADLQRQEGEVRERILELEASGVPQRESRIERRRLKRIRQKLNKEPALVRLGRH
jgi:tetratricopeptide (TPR) repeat protein